MNLAAADDELNTARKQLEQTTNIHKKLQNELNASKSKLQTAEQQLAQIDKQITKLQNEITEAAQLQQQTRIKIEQLQNQEFNLQQDINNQYKVIAVQIRSAFMRSNHNEPLRLLLNQQNIGQISRNLTYYKYLANARNKQITQFANLLTEINLTKQQIVQNQEQQQKQINQLEDKKHHLKQTQKKRSELIKQLKSEQQITQTKLADNKQQQSKLNNLIKKIEQQNIINRQKELLAANKGEFSKQRGKLQLPASGKVLAKFGSKNFGAVNLWGDGILLETTTDTNVRAIYHGKIAYANWMTGLGYVMIIDHGSGYLSLYGHNDRLYKKTGEIVFTGEVIANIAHNNNLNKNTLYFSILHEGKVQNPLTWCK